MTILRDLFTGIDGLSHDLGRWSWAGSWAGVTGAAVANWLHGGVIDVQGLAMAYGVVAGAHGAALWAKKDTEPKQ